MEKFNVEFRKDLVWNDVIKDDALKKKMQEKYHV